MRPLFGGTHKKKHCTLYKLQPQRQIFGCRDAFGGVDMEFSIVIPGKKLVAAAAVTGKQISPLHTLPCTKKAVPERISGAACRVRYYAKVMLASKADLSSRWPQK